MSFELTQTDNKIIEAIQDKKGRDITVIDLKGLSPITDKFIIATADSDIQTRAIVNAITRTLKDNGLKNPYKIDGLENLDGWVIIDYYDFMIHIFTEEKREYYNLERLWNHAQKIDIENIEFIKNME